MTDSSSVFAFLGVASPTATQQTQMDRVVEGVIDDIKSACNWHLDYATKTELLPERRIGGVVHDNRVYTARLAYPFQSKTSRIQLSSMVIKAIDSIYEDESASGDEGSGDFSPETLLVSGVDYYLDCDLDASIGWSGGVIRIGRTWSNVPRSIKLTYSAGFNNTDYSTGGIAASLRNFALNKAADRFCALQSRTQAFVTGVGEGGDTSGLLASERLGDYAMSIRNPLEMSKMVGMAGLLDEDIDFLMSRKFVLMNAGV